MNISSGVMLKLKKVFGVKIVVFTLSIVDTD